MGKANIKADHEQDYFKKIHVMKTKILIMTLLAGISGFAQKKIDNTHFNNLLKNQNYEQLLIDATTERNTVYGKIWQIDYYIAKAACGLGKPHYAIEWFNSSLKYPNVNNDIRKFLLAEMGNCNSEQTNDTRTITRVSMPDLSLLSMQNSLTAVVKGKAGPILNCKTPPQAVITVYPKTSGELQSRLFDVNRSSDAINKYKETLNSNYHITVSGRFLLITYGKTVLNDQQIKQTSERLERTYMFYSSHYNLRPPDKLLAVYLLPDKAKLRQTALLVHGIKIPDANIGYSNLSDLSLVGISDITHIGTLCHELFHIMIRTDVGDVPPWMDEGIACIYETSVWKGNELHGDLLNWRTDVLEAAQLSMSEDIPHLSEFLNYTWQQYDGIQANDICTGAINYAYGKHLMLYCQETGKLTELVTAMKNRVKSRDTGDAVFQTDTEIFEKVFNQNLENIEDDFDEWMYKTYRIKLNKNSIAHDDGETHFANTREIMNQSVQPNQEVLNSQSVARQNAQATDSNAADFQQSIPQQSLLSAGNSINFNQQSVPVNEANDVLNSVSVHVKINNNDLIGESAAFTYYLDGTDETLDKILEVNYQRNHPTMSEFKSKTYRKSTIRENNFSFKAYQWGTIDDAYVYIVMKDGTISELILKPIIYDK
jgi:hypothetical protein